MLVPKIKWFGGWWLVLASILCAQHKTTIMPLDFQKDDDPGTFVQGILQLETDGKHLMIRSENSYILTIDRQGNLLGRTEYIPFGSPAYQQISGFAVSGSQLALINNKNAVFLLENGAFQSYFSAAFYHGAMPTDTTNAFAFSGNRLVLPALPKTGKLAMVLHRNGDRIQDVGEPQAFPPDLIWPQQSLNATFWVKEGSYWYALFKYQPRILKFNERFRLVAEFPLSGDEINEGEARLHDPSAQDLEYFSYSPPPHFSDFKAFRGKLYAMCSGVLLEIDANTGQALQRYYFFGKTQDFGHLPEAQRITLPIFTILDDGSLVLAHPGLLWNHDLWIADVNLGDQS